MKGGMIMNKTEKLALVVLIVLSCARMATAGDLQAGWYAKIYSPYVYVPGQWGPQLRTEGYFYGSPTGQYGPFKLTGQGGSSDYTYRDVSVLADAPGVDPSQSLIMPVDIPLSYGTPIAYIGLSCQTNSDPIQMRLEFWRTRANGQDELVWFQRAGGVNYLSQEVLHERPLEGPCFFKVAVAPPGGFPDLSPPSITIESPKQYGVYYNRDSEAVPVHIVIKDYGVGNADVSIALDDQPFAGKLVRNEAPGNVLDIASGIDIANLDNGLHTFEVVASDRAGNVSSQSELFAIQHLDDSIVGWGSFTLDTRLGHQACLPPRLTNVSAISAGDTHCLALKSDGTVVSWGNLTVGYTKNALATPPGLAGVIAVSASHPSPLSPPCEHSLALKLDGSVVGWGYDSGSQATPPQGLTNAVAISAGSHHNLALKSDGSVVGWGQSTAGETSPPSGLRDAVAVAAGQMHGLALKTNGIVVGWGDNRYGQAAPPPGLRDVVAISAGGFHGLALKSDGTVAAWGYNFYGQATPPPGLANVVAISAGTHHSLALKSDGTVVGWGSNLNGQATAPAGLTNVVAISAGYQHSLALRDNTPPQISLQSPTDGQTYRNTCKPIPVAFTFKDDFDPHPTAALTLDGQPFSGSEIVTSGLAFGDHTLQVIARDKFGNTGMQAATFTVVPEPMAFSITDLKVEWRHDEGKPKADRIKVSGEFSLPAGYTPSLLSRETILVVEIGGSKGSAAALGRATQDRSRWNYRRTKYDHPAGFNMDIKKLNIHWSKSGGPGKFKVDGDLDVGVFNDGSGIVTITVILPVSSGGDLAGTQSVNCKTHKYGWDYHN